MATRKKTTKKTTKKRTLSEFRAWLEGVEELQGSDWSPDADQWKLIRAAIDGIIQEEPEVVEVQTPPSHPIPRTAAPAPAPAAPQMITEPAPSALQAPPPTEVSPAARQVMNGGGVPSSMAPDSSGKLKTPNIDTHDGNYDSGFA